MQRQHSICRAWAMVFVLAGCIAAGVASAANAPANAPAQASAKGASTAKPAGTAQASKGESSSDLDQKAIHAAYNEGDFDKVVRIINDFTARHPQTSRGDSIFVAKHLAVVFSANPETREKGKYYMYRLLEMMPSAELVDMFVSDEVDRIFEKVRKEFMVRQQNFGVDSTQVALPSRPDKNNATTAAPVATGAGTPASDKKQAKADSKGVDPVWWWVAGGAVALGAGITAAIVLSQPEAEKGPKYVVDFGGNP